MSDNPLNTFTGPFTLLVAPEIALAAAKRLESVRLSRRGEHLDKRKGKAVDPETAEFDEAVESGKVR